MKLSSHFVPAIALAALLTPGFAQSSGDLQTNPPAQPPYPQASQNNYPSSPGGNMPGGPEAQYPHFPADPGFNATPVPRTLVIPGGKYLTVRTLNFVSSDRNQPGDFFSATLVEPLVVDGFVVAARGQTVNGRVVDVQKAGRVKGVSSLRVELTELHLVDGQQVPFRSQMVYRHGETSVGNDVGAVGGTAAVGAAIGAAATGSGLYAGVGALAGAAAATIGVLSTRGRPTVIGPETLLTFRVEQPVTISTAQSAGAFTTVARDDYDQPRERMRPSFDNGRYAAGPPVLAPRPYFYGAPYWNTGLFLYGGPRFYGGYGRGWGRRW